MANYESMDVERKRIDMGNDSVVIRQYNGGVTGGRALDYSNFSEEVIKAGHILVKRKVDDIYEYAPLGVDNGAYKAITTYAADAEYAGVVVRSRLKGEAVAIMDDGRVNDIAMPYPITDEMRAELKKALPNLIFEHD